MNFAPRFTVSARLLRELEIIADLRAKIAAATVQVAWTPRLSQDSRQRGAHASTAIEGNPLTLAEVRALADGATLPVHPERARREVLNYFAGLRWVEKRARQKKPVTHDDLFHLHGLLAKEVMEQGEAGRYRTIAVRVGRHLPPSPDMVSGLMRELLAWWNQSAWRLSPVLSSAILHYRFEAIHPFADGNGRTGRALALWELYRRGFDTHHIFSVDEYYWEDRPRYYAALQDVRRTGEDLTAWLEYCAEGIRQTLERAWMRIRRFQVKSAGKLILRPRQEALLHLLRDHASMAPREIWQALGVSRQGAMDLLRPLVDAGLVEKIGGKKTGRYRLRTP